MMFNLPNLNCPKLSNPWSSRLQLKKTLFLLFGKILTVWIPLSSMLKSTTMYSAQHSGASFLQKEGHFLIEGHIENGYKGVESLSFINEFLVDEVLNHVNIIHFRLNEQLRSFKMDKNRQKISLVYD